MKNLYGTYKYIVSILFAVLFMPCFLLAQNTVPVTGNLTGQNVDKVACKQVHIVSGFHYNAQSNLSMHAHINPYGMCEIDYQNNLTPLDNNGSLGAFNKSLEVGTTPGNFQVSPSGAATYNIPLSVAPGTMGMEPKLSLNYNSQSGTGLMGIGWDVMGFGLSAITRTSQNVYYDGKSFPVSLNNNDRFVLDGSRLIPTTSSSIYGDVGIIYGTEAESFSRITSVGGQAGNPDHFIVETKSGLILEYGTAPNTQIKINSSTTIFTWLLNQVTDIYGNYMIITYNVDNVNNGEYFPDRIDYTGNAGAGKSPYNYVKFVYDTKRSDKQTAYIAGTSVKQNILLVAIEMHSSGGNIAHEYDFNYSYAFGATHLDEIVEVGQDKKQFNSTKMVWGAPNEDGTPGCNSASYFNAKQGSYLPFDFNGDGHTDIATITNGNIFLHRNDFVNQNTFTSMGFKTIGGNNIVPFLNQSNLVNLDLDGNGLEDIIVYQGTAGVGGLGQITDNITFSSLYATQGATSINNFTNGPVISFSSNPNKTGSKFLLGDFDGDGATDIFSYYYDQDNWYIYSFRLNHTYQSNPSVDYGDKTISFNTVDFNGDGKNEILMFYKNYYQVLEFNPASPNVLSTSGVVFDYPVGRFIYGWGDFNGDNRTDVLTWKSGEGWQIGYRNGNTFTTVNAPVEDHGDPTFIPGHQPAYEYFVADFNSDGKQDIVEKSNTTSNLPRFRISFSNGAGFDPAVDVVLDCVIGGSLINMSQAFSCTVGDYDGDGNQDILYKNINSSTTQAYIINFSAGIRNAHRVTQLNNGLDYKITVEYQTLPRLAKIYGEYTKNSSAVFPVMDYQQVFNVARNITRSNGLANQANTTNYLYKGAKVHLQGKGFLGFSEMSTSDAASQIKERNIYDAPATSNFFQPTLHEKITSNYTLTSNNVISDKVYGYSTTTLGTQKRYYTYLNSFTDNDLLHGTITTNTYHQDSNGNTDDVTSVNNAVSVHTVNVYEAKTAVSGGWPVYPLLNTSTTNTRLGSVFTLSEEYINDNLGRHTKITAKNSNGVATLVTDLSDPDNFGHLLTSTVTSMFPSAGTPRTTHSGYDIYGRFVTSQINPLNQTRTFTYNDAYGNVLTETDLNGLTTQYLYDGFGRIKQTITPTSQLINKTYLWTGGNAPVNSLYQVKLTETGAPTASEYFDLLGRSLRKQTMGFNGDNINIDITYNAIGRLSTQSEPYYENGGSVQNNTYLYNDAFVRPTKVTTAAGAVTDYIYTYGVNTLTTNTTGAGAKSVTKNFDASGLLASLTDDGGTLSYTYHGSGKPLTITVPGTNKQIIMEYNDGNGNQTKLNDPDAGPVTYTYNGFGEILNQTDAKGNSFDMDYDLLGRLHTKANNSIGTITYTYDNKTKGIGMIGTETGMGITCEYSYDDFARLKSKTETIEGTDYINSFEYDDLSRILKETYPGGFSVVNLYNNNGYQLKTVKGNNLNLIWECTGMSERNQVLASSAGNGGSITKTYTSFGFLQSIKAKERLGTGTAVDAIDETYNFDAVTGNLSSRLKNLPTPVLTEDFTPYDNLDRLKSVKLNTVSTQSLTYDPNGNILSKSDAGTGYSYAGSQPHAVSAINFPTSNISTVQQDVTYNSFLKASNISQAPYSLDYTYGPEFDRKKSILKNNGTTEKTIIYGGSYEKITNNLTNTVYDVYYINTPDGLSAINVKTNGASEQLYFVHTDYLGSIMSLYDGNGNKVYEQSFDAWGRTRNTDWTYNANTLTQPEWLIRGYTGHEHLPQFGLINMNARLYDPLVGRVLRPDNFVQNVDATQAFNRYSYVHNNPLKYTDPNGEWVEAALGAILGGYQGYSIGKQLGYKGADLIASTLGGALIGAATAELGYAISSSGIPFAHSAALAATSFSSSAGFSILSGGRTPVSVNFGLASYNFSSNKFSTDPISLLSFASDIYEVGADKRAYERAMARGEPISDDELSSLFKKNKPWFGNYFGPSKYGVDPELLKDQLGKSPENGLGLDLNAFNHDIEYYNTGSNGFAGSFLSTRTINADLNLAKSASSVFASNYTDFLKNIEVRWALGASVGFSGISALKMISNYSYLWAIYPH